MRPILWYNFITFILFFFLSLHLQAVAFLYDFFNKITKSVSESFFKWEIGYILKKLLIFFLIHCRFGTQLADSKILRP